MNTELAARRWVALSIVLGCALLATIHTPTRAREARVVEEPSRSLPSAQCRARGTDARLLAHALERSAISDWQRAPFSSVAAQRAEHKMSEAQACYRAAGDRAREAHAATLGRRYRAQHVRRPARAQARNQGWLHHLALAARELQP
ncbi:MAG TPA: hypothetical protein VI299_02730 [Polyangiales bacterium]